jgi:hypothetical protein
MLNILLLIAIIQVFAYGAPDCTPPPDAVAKLRGYLSYMSREGLWSPGAKHFSLAEADGDALFLQHEVPQHFDETQRFVYAFRKGNRLLAAGCPADPEWTKCAEKDFRELIHEPASSLQGPVGAACDLTITVPAWRPSPDSPFKRSLASEVLQELMEYGAINPREVYVRDFNVADPELDFYIIDREGKDDLQGCTLDADLHPHCAWHLYGMSPLAKLKRGIMAQPYKLFPPAGRPAR